jgi:uncharacterized protein YecE (DUF72 family)
MIHIGTSGYSYDDWVGPFYPPDLDKKEWLSYYAREFDCTEINYTYYRLPNRWTLANMAKKTPEGFLFTIKASQELTHERGDNAESFAKFVEALQPLREMGKFGCILAQFPFSFHATRENADYLRALPERFAGLPTVVELRNAAWLGPETFDLLRQQRLGFCAVDEPRLPGLIPPVAEVTGPVAYVRFHGRNAAKWWQHEQAYERYDYRYSAAELAEWQPRIQEMAQKAESVFVFSNNHWQGQAVEAARQLKLLLE